MLLGLCLFLGYYQRHLCFWPYKSISHVCNCLYTCMFLCMRIIWINNKTANIAKDDITSQHSEILAICYKSSIVYCHKKISISYVQKSELCCVLYVCYCWRPRPLEDVVFRVEKFVKSKVSGDSWWSLWWVLSMYVVALSSRLFLVFFLLLIQPQQSYHAVQV